MRLLVDNEFLINPLHGDVVSAASSDVTQNQNSHLPEPVRIIHKEQESISAFCLNLINPGLLSLATPRY